MFNKLRKAFGFQVDDEDIMQDDTRALAPSLPTAPVNTTPGDNPESIDVDVNIIFNHVIEVFNNSLPDFLKQSVDPQAQRKYLYDTLDQNIQRYLADINARANAACEQRWLAERSNLNDQVKQLETSAKEIESKRLELAQRQLSADRQKRAMSDRLHDLEKHISKLEADREQLDLENKSLINKLKVTSVFEKENDELHAEVNRLHTELLHLRSGQGLSAVDAEAEKKLAEAEQKVAEAEASAKDAGARLEQMLNDQTNLKRENNKLNATIESHLDTIKRLNDKISKSETTINDQQAQIDELAATKREADEVAAQLEDIEAQIAQFQIIKDEKDAIITRLKAELKQARAQAAESSPENLAVAADKPNRQPKNRDRRTQRRDDRNKDNANGAKGPKPQTPIEDILTDTDWLVTPGDQKPPKHKNNTKSRPNNDPQLSLF